MLDHNEQKHPYQRMSLDSSTPPPPHHILVAPSPASISTPSPFGAIPILPDSSLLSGPSLPPPPHHHLEHPVIPIADPGSGAHDSCSATCVLSHPRRSASIYLLTLFSIVALATALLIVVKAVRGDEEPVNSSAAHAEVLSQFVATNVTVLRPSLSSSFKSTSTGSSAHALLHSLEHTLEQSPAIHTLASVTPKVPDDGDMLSAMIMLMWGLSPLASAVLTISWTYYTYRDREDEVGGGGGAGDEQHKHHHHPKLVNPNPPLSSDEEGADFQLYPPSATSNSPGAHAASVRRASSSVQTVVEQPQPEPELPPPLRNVRSQTVVVAPSSLIRRNVSPPPPPSGSPTDGSVAAASPAAGFSVSPSSGSPSSGLAMPPFSRVTRSVTAPSAPTAHVEAARSRCRRQHTVHPFYSRVSPPRPRFWFVPTNREQLMTLWAPFKRFMVRCYFLPILIPTVAAVVQYVLAGSMGFTGWLSSAFVPTLANALSLPVGAAGEAWAVVLSFFYELLFGCWWDPFPPGSADWGKGMNFHGASWLALSAMEEIGWAGLLFPCLYELYPNNPAKASILTGIAWSAWHWPFLVFGQLGWLPESAAYHPGLLSTPFVYGFLTFTLSTTFSRVIMVRLLFWSDDLWSQCVYHAAHNVMVFNFFAQLPETRDDEFPYAGLFIAEAGIPVVTIYLVVAAWTIKLWYDADALRVLEDHLRDSVSERRRASPGGVEMGPGGSAAVAGAASARPFEPQMSPIAEEKEGWLASAEEDGKAGAQAAGRKVRRRGEKVGVAGSELSTPLL